MFYNFKDVFTDAQNSHTIISNRYSQFHITIYLLTWIGMVSSLHFFPLVHTIDTDFASHWIITMA